MRSETGVGQAGRVAAVVRDVLGRSVIGAYLHGSAVRGGLHPTSDIDVLVITRRPSTSGERRELLARLMPMSGRGDPTGRSRSVDLAIVVQADVRPWRYPPRLDFQYGDWLRRDFELGQEAPWSSPSPDLALQLAMALEASRPLAGPGPTAILDPVPFADVRRAMLDGIPGLLSDLDGDERNVVLTFARIWMSLMTGVIASKDGAADWVLPRLPPEHRAVLAHARAIYLGDTPEDWGGLLEQIRPYVDHVLAEIRRVSAT